MIWKNVLAMMFKKRWMAVIDWEWIVMSRGFKELSMMKVLKPSVVVRW
jgi:hypothetical protein